MPTVVGVRLRFSKTLWFDPAGATPEEGDVVLVETERGIEIGKVTQPPHFAEPDQLPAPLKPMLRLANEEDLALIDELKVKEREAMSVFRELVAEHKLDMKPVDVEFMFDGDKIVFYFSAEERVDFREIVRELASRFHARIDMRQVGVRDEARAVGGVGHCGQMLCCARFGGEFQPVSIRMAKEQDLPLNPLKISGLCGRLMCCLRYEVDAYKDYKSRAPKRGAMVETPTGAAKVTDLNTPKETVTLRLEDGSNVAVPLASLHCSKGGTCPCSVSKEALEAVQAPSALAVAIAEAAAAPAPAPQPKSAPAAPAEEGQGRRRRRRGKSGGGEEKPQAGKQPEAAKRAPKPAAEKPADKAAEKPKAEAAEGESAEKTGRTVRRRRRRRSGGGAGGETAS